MSGAGQSWHWTASEGPIANYLRTDRRYCFDMGMTPAEGHMAIHNPAAKIHSCIQRCGGLAACGGRAAAGDDDDRVPSQLVIRRVQARLELFYNMRDYVEAGGLMS